MPTLQLLKGVLEEVPFIAEKHNCGPNASDRLNRERMNPKFLGSRSPRRWWSFAVEPNVWAGANLQRDRFNVESRGIRDLTAFSIDCARHSSTADAIKRPQTIPLLQAYFT